MHSRAYHSENALGENRVQFWFRDPRNHFINSDPYGDGGILLI